MKTYSRIVLSLLSLIVLAFFVFFIYIHRKRSIPDFHLCGLGKTYPYYAAQEYYQEDFFHFKEYIQTEFNTTNIYVERNIIIRIQFMINCDGVAGNYKVKSYNFNYESISIQKKITNQFVEMIDKYHKWNPPVNLNNKTINIFKFYAFRLKNNKVIEISPK